MYFADREFAIVQKRRLRKDMKNIEIIIRKKSCD